MKIISPNHVETQTEPRTVSPSPVPAPMKDLSDDFKRLQDALHTLQGRVAKWGDDWPALVEKSLQPSLQQLEEKWTSIAQEWNSQFEKQQASLTELQALVQTLSQQQVTPAPAPVPIPEPTPASIEIPTPPAEESAPSVTEAMTHDPFSAPAKPSLSSRLWKYLNGTAIEIPIKKP